MFFHFVAMNDGLHAIKVRAVRLKDLVIHKKLWRPHDFLVLCKKHKKALFISSLDIKPS